MRKLIKMEFYKNSIKEGESSNAAEAKEILLTLIRKVDHKKFLRRRPKNMILATLRESGNHKLIQT